MTVTIFGASGMVGKQLIFHSLSRGWEVKAFGRNIDEWIDEEKFRDHFKAIKGYVFDAGDVQKALKGSDAVLSALGGDIAGTDKTRSLGMKNIVAQMEKYGPKRIVALGGLGVLDSPDGNGPIFMQEGYPKEYIPVGREHYEAYSHLKNSNLQWTFFCSPDILDAEANGLVELCIESPATNYQVYAGNLAMAMVQVVDTTDFNCKRVGISNR